MFKKINSLIIALAMMLSIFSAVSVSAASLDGLTLSYNFTNDTAGIADGTVTVSGITAEVQADITNINLYWGKSSTEKIDDYYDLKNYTLTGPSGTDRAAAGMSLLAYSGEKFVCELSGNLRIPEAASYLIAEVVTASENKQLSVEIPENKKLVKAEDELLYSMIWASDIHFRKSAALSTSSQKVGMLGAVEVSKIHGDKFKGMILNGDIADNAADYEYAMAESTFEKSGVDFPIYYASGNHDTAMNSNGISKWDECAKALDVRFDKLEKEYGLTFDRSDPWSYETYIGGHHYIFLATPYETSYSVSDEQLKWLEEKICYDEKSGTPTFVFTHLPIKDTVTQSTTSGGIENDALISLFERHPQVMVITSHIHLELNSDLLTTAVNTEGGNTFIDTSSMYDTYWVADGVSKNIGATAQGRYLEFYDDLIVIKSRNFIDNKWIPRAEHIIPINGLDNPFEGDFTIASTSSEGTIEVGTKLTAKLNNADIPTGYTVTWYDMTGEKLGEGNEYTAVTANESISAKIVKDKDSSYARAVARYIAPVTDDGTGDEETGEDTTLVYDNTTDCVYNGDIVTVKGSADVALAGKNAALVLIPKSSYQDLSTAKYVGSCTIADDGTYSFKFKADEISENDILLVNAGNTTIAANQITRRTNEEFVEVDAVVDADAKLTLSLKNVLFDTENTNLIIATYDSTDGLINAVVEDYKLAFGENGELQTYTYDTALSGSYVKVYLWTNIFDMTPISKGDRAELPVAATE